MTLGKAHGKAYGKAHGKASSRRRGEFRIARPGPPRRAISLRFMAVQKGEPNGNNTECRAQPGLPWPCMVFTAGLTNALATSFRPLAARRSCPPQLSSSRQTAFPHHRTLAIQFCRLGEFVELRYTDN